MEQVPVPSPRWSSTTKLLIGLIAVGIAAFLVYRFSNLISPLLMILIIVYLLHPVAAMISNGLRLSWKISVNILFLIILLLLVGLLTLGGVGLVGQVQSLITSVQNIVANLPTYVEQLSKQVFTFGPFTIDMGNLMRNLDLPALSQQLLSLIQPLLAQTGNIVAALAGGAAEIFGWTFFVWLVSYFIMIESSGLRGDLFKVELPGYREDFERLGNELSRIWNAFLRGQILVFTLAVGIYSILLPILGVRYALGLALMAGLAKFLPYIGPSITWIVMGLVTLIQENPFGLQHWIYAAIVVGTTLVIDQIIDSFITPRIMARTLKVHPAAVLIVALISASLLGILGVVIAAPLLATFLLLGRYVTRKMFDMNPWPEKATEIPPVGSEWFKRIKQFLFRGRKQIQNTNTENTENTQPAPSTDVPTQEIPSGSEGGAENPRKPAKHVARKIRTRIPDGMKTSSGKSRPHKEKNNG